LAKLGYTARLAKACSYLHFQFGEAADWLDRTANVPTFSSRTVQEWIEDFGAAEELPFMLCTT